MSTPLKSQFDTNEIYIATSLYLGLLVYVPYKLAETNLWEPAIGIIIQYLVIGSIPFVLYALAASLINIYYFYDDRVKIVYITRFTNREKEILYADIKEIWYINAPGRRPAVVEIILHGKEHTMILKAGNCFYHSNFKKRVEILKFLESKGIPLFVNSDFKKDLEAFPDKKYR